MTKEELETHKKKLDRYKFLIRMMEAKNQYPILLEEFVRQIEASRDKLVGLQPVDPR